MFYYEVDNEIQLKLITQNDAEEIFTFIDRSRNYLSKWLGWVENTKTVEDTRAFAAYNLEKFAKREGLDTAILYKGQFVGKISINTINWSLKKCEIGYFLDESFQGEGIMTRAAKGMIDIAFKEYKLQKVEIHAAVGNKKSRHIAERLGFMNEGTIRNAEWLYDHFVDHAVYGLLKEEWLEE
ncbi:GNAT family N-acetyltransferase [Lysinibacillus sp. 2017]|uniref:GNAT family N-acetyltransferase n=1 Tax=unclassified Lysinibacillus TaxID=2636778 RepID=UPI000D52676E|nr:MULTISPECIES: GNAT family protein [unclassified Lysinibacillus]AWE07606.1 GNAT family N-acetyltransferase [Lysinibacillus sp. 2017]TGN36769.1 N-acetyltransferase [Lysinibacillus sp. S2017]